MPPQPSPRVLPHEMTACLFSSPEVPSILSWLRMPMSPPFPDTSSRTDAHRKHRKRRVWLVMNRVSHGAAIFLRLVPLLLSSSVDAVRPSNEALRTFNGTGNNPNNADWGSVGSTQVRLPSITMYERFSLLTWRLVEWIQQT